MRVTRSECWPAVTVLLHDVRPVLLARPERAIRSVGDGDQQVPGIADSAQSSCFRSHKIVCHWRSLGWETQALAATAFWANHDQSMRNGPRSIAVRITSGSEGGIHSIHQVAPASASAWMATRSLSQSALRPRPPTTISSGVVEVR